jgi:nucleoid DNA-binding protein
MYPKQNLQKFAAAVVKRSGICLATVEQVLPAVFDEIRFQLCEAKRPCVPIDSFGTFAVVDIPERTRRYTYKEKDELRTYPPEKRLKFRPAYNMKRELQAGQFDPTRQSFTRHPDDPIIRKRRQMHYQGDGEPIHIGNPKRKTGDR